MYFAAVYEIIILPKVVFVISLAKGEVLKYGLYRMLLISGQFLISIIISCSRKTSTVCTHIDAAVGVNDKNVSKA